MCLKYASWVANIVRPDQMLPSMASDLALTPWPRINEAHAVDYRYVDLAYLE